MTPVAMPWCFSTNHQNQTIVIPNMMEERDQFWRISNLKSGLTIGDSSEHIYLLFNSKRGPGQCLMIFNRQFL